MLSCIKVAALITVKCDTDASASGRLLRQQAGQRPPCQATGRTRGSADSKLSLNLLEPVLLANLLPTSSRTCESESVELV